MEKEKEIILLKECLLIEIEQLKSKRLDTSTGEYLQRLQQLVSETAIKIERIRRVTDKAVQTVTEERTGEEERGTDRQVEVVRVYEWAGREEAATSAVHVVAEEEEEGERTEPVRGELAVGRSRRRWLLRWIRRCCCCCCPRESEEEEQDIL